MTAERRQCSHATTARGRRRDDHHKLGFGAEPGLMTRQTPACDGRRAVVASSSCRRHAIMSSVYRRHLAAMLTSRRRGIASSSSKGPNHAELLLPLENLVRMCLEFSSYLMSTQMRYANDKCGEVLGAHKAGPT